MHPLAPKPQRAPVLCPNGGFNVNYQTQAKTACLGDPALGRDQDHCDLFSSQWCGLEKILTCWTIRITVLELLMLVAESS